MVIGPGTGKGAKGANFWGSGVGALAGQKLVSKVAKVANFWGSGVGNLAGQKLYSKVANVEPTSG
jgi:hypothetical protein